MPFGQLPSSPGFMAPPTPDWTQFARQAVDLIAHRPIPNTAQYVNDAVNQIDDILKMSSPQAKMERAVNMLQLQTQYQMYKDYQQHPENYMWTQHGLINRNPLDTALKALHMQNLVLRNQALNRPIQGTGIDDLRSNIFHSLGQTGPSAVAEPSSESNEVLNDTPDKYLSQFEDAGQAGTPDETGTTQ